jgi:uncharacterized protein
MRALVDTNVFISYLLDPEKNEKLQSVVEAAFEGEYTLILPAELLEELKKKIVLKPYLIKHVSKEVYERFLEALTAIVELIPSLTEPIPEVSRDKQDDYLFSYAVVGEADYLVSGDEDVLVVKQIHNVQIVRPSEFYDVLKKKS